MKRTYRGVLMVLALLSLTGCHNPDIVVDTGRLYANVRSYNGYVISGYTVTETEDGYSITVTAEMG